MATVPPELVQELSDAEDALTAAQDADKQAATDKAAVAKVQATADASAAAALASHQSANVLALKAIADVTAYLGQTPATNGSTPASPSTPETAPAGDTAKHGKTR
jgi:hypothetical protein